MKKLISVFVAMALVGSLAAQKRKAAPKKPAAPAAPAAPVVAAPAAPVVAAPAMPSADMAGKGMGLFVDLRGSYTFANGSSTAQIDGQAAADANTASVVNTYKSSGSAGFGGGLSLGYDIAPGLSIVGSYDIRSIQTREFKNASNLGAGATADAVTQQKWTNQVIGLGLRPHVNALGGEVYGGMGLAVVLPFETTQTTTISGATAAYNTGSGTLTAVETVKGYNLALGAYGEVGYKYMVTDMIGINIGVRGVIATANNIDKTKVVKNTNVTPQNNDNFATMVTTTYKESFSSAENTTEAAANSSASRKSLAAFETLGITDFSANVGVSLKF